MQPWPTGKPTDMTQQQLNRLMEHPELLGEDTLRGLRQLVADYPYFQTAWVLYLKNLYLLHDASFADELRRGALFVADVGVLFYYIEGERFKIETHEAEEGKDAAEGDRTLALIDRFLSELPKPMSEELPLPEMAAVDYTSVLMKEEASSEAPGALPLRGQELIDSFIEKASEGQAMQVPEDKEGAEAEKEENAPVREDDEEEGGEENYFTETLAKIYIKQQRYDKALEIIKKLNLKYRKKNTYFADQIRFLEKLIINAKSK